MNQDEDRHPPPGRPGASQNRQSEQGFGTHGHQDASAPDPEADGFSQGSSSGSRPPSRQFRDRQSGFPGHGFVGSAVLGGSIGPGGRSGGETHAGQSQQASQGHRGRGPKGYIRSDARILEIVCERLTEDHLIDASDVSVEVRDGIVTLSGAVESRWLKHRIEDMVEASSGVMRIENRMTVRAGSSETSSGGPVSGGALESSPRPGDQ